jgi:hypothetical protein
MGRKQSQVMEELTKFCQAACFDLPLAAAKGLFGAGDENILSEAGWKAYDAWIRFANEATNELYANRAVGELTGSAMETMLRIQHFGESVTAGVFGNLWPAIGLPGASEISSLREEVIALQEKLRVKAAPGGERPSAPSKQATSSDDGLRLIWNRPLSREASFGTAR